MSVYTLFITLASSGVNLATSRIVSEQMAYGKEDDIRTAVKKCINYSLFMGVISCIILFLFAPYISTYWLHSKVSYIPLRIIAISLPFLSVSSSINGYFTAIRNVKKTAFAQVFEQILQIYLVTFFINYFLPSGIEYACISLVLGSCISEIASFLLILFFYKRDIRKNKVIKNKEDNYTKQILKITIPIALTSYIRSGLSTLKQILIPMRLEKSGISCEEALSQYGIINGMAMPLIMFPCTFISSFSMLLIPEFSYLNAKKNYEKINFAINKILKYCFIFSFLIMGIFWCFSGELSNSIYNESNVSIFIKVLSPLIVLMYIDSVVDGILKGLDKQVSVMVINILDLFTSISFIYFLLPIQGIKGYIVVLFISEIFNGLVSLLLLIKETKVKIDFINWLIKPSLAVILLNYIFKNYTCNNLFELILQIIIFCICYFIVTILLKGLVKEDFKF
jgi:stage V sporulation protein B